MSYNQNWAQVGMASNGQMVGPGQLGALGGFQPNAVAGVGYAGVFKNAELSRIITELKKKET